MGSPCRILSSLFTSREAPSVPESRVEINPIFIFAPLTTPLYKEIVLSLPFFPRLRKTSPRKLDREDLGPSLSPQTRDRTQWFSYLGQRCEYTRQIRMDRRGPSIAQKPLLPGSELVDRRRGETPFGSSLFSGAPCIYQKLLPSTNWDL